MNLPEKFECGRFKLESFFVYLDKDGICDILINGRRMRVTDPRHTECVSASRETYERLNSAKTIIAYDFVNHEHYSITIRDDWVYIEKCY